VILESSSQDILYTNYCTGVHGNCLKPTIRAAGLAPDNLPLRDPQGMAFDRENGSSKPKAWRDIRGAGQGIGVIDAIVPVAALVERLEREYQAALLAL